MNTDLAATISEIAGAAPPSAQLDGTSFLRLILHPERREPWRKRFLIEHYLGIWDDAPNRLIDQDSQFALQTTPDSAGPSVLYIEQYPGRQLVRRRVRCGRAV